MSSHVSNFRRPLILVVSLSLIVAFRVIPIRADSNATDFENFSTGTVDGQNGWNSTGSVNPPMLDVAVVDNTLYPSFGSKSLRLSNAVADSQFGNQTFSNSLANEAGEVGGDSVNGGFSGGTRQPFFDAQWDFASTTPNAEQVGLRMVASPDRGDGARMSYIGMSDTPTGLQVDFFDYQRAVPGGFVGPTVIADGLDRTQPHTIRVTMNFVDGPTAVQDPGGTAPENDIVCVYVDNVLSHQGTSWENYLRDNFPPGSRTVDSVMFRVSGSGLPALQGKGFLVDNFSSLSGPVPTGAETGCLPPIQPPTPPPPPPPANTSNSSTAEVPLCSLIGGGTNSIVRADVSSSNVFCQILAENGTYLRSAAEVGDINLINQGVFQAVDIFAFGSAGQPLTTLGQPVKVCLLGSGQFFFRDATGQPRMTALLASTQENGYTCAFIPNAGTVVLIGSGA